jgi:Secretion system C-terminal sorting domain
MKRSILILIAVFIALSSGAQVKQEVIASAGGYNVSGGVSISWTLGETVIPTFQNGNLILTHGFQSQLIVTAVEENLDVLVNIKVFPNPASEIVNIQFDTPVDGEIVVYLLDSQGRLVKRDLIEPAMAQKQLNLQDMAAGIYYIKLVKGKLVNVYKVVKL